MRPLQCTDGLGPRLHHKTIIGLFPGVPNQTETELFSVGDKKQFWHRNCQLQFWPVSSVTRLLDIFIRYDPDMLIPLTPHWEIVMLTPSLKLNLTITVTLLVLTLNWKHQHGHKSGLFLRNNFLVLFGLRWLSNIQWIIKSFQRHCMPCKGKTTTRWAGSCCLCAVL